MADVVFRAREVERYETRFLYHNFITPESPGFLNVNTSESKIQFEPADTVLIYHTITRIVRTSADRLVWPISQPDGSADYNKALSFFDFNIQSFFHFYLNGKFLGKIPSRNISREAYYDVSGADWNLRLPTCPFAVVHPMHQYEIPSGQVAQAGVVNVFPNYSGLEIGGPFGGTPSSTIPFTNPDFPFTGQILYTVNSSNSANSFFTRATIVTPLVVHQRCDEIRFKVDAVGYYGFSFVPGTSPGATTTFTWNARIFFLLIR
jgi:hypothetical protein